jgi:hypothetical protein
VVKATPRPLLPGNKPLPMSLGGPQGLSGGVRKISSLPEFDSRTVQPVASRYTGYAYVYNETGCFIIYIGLVHTQLAHGTF